MKKNGPMGSLFTKEKVISVQKTAQKKLVKKTMLRFTCDFFAVFTVILSWKVSWNCKMRMEHLDFFLVDARIVDFPLLLCSFLIGRRKAKWLNIHHPE